jgi:hypothetical protein
MKYLEIIDLAKNAHFMGNHVCRYVLSLPMPELGFERVRGLGFEFLVCFLVSIPIWFL